MTQADSVLSTPPTNTPVDMLVDPIRRKFLIVAAVASAISACTLAAATMATQSVPVAVTMPRVPQPACSAVQS